ncbi:MAG TPA: hypothetical protein VF467_15045 [Afipia sp.]
MIGLLIGGTVVLCVGLLTVVFGIPIKEFSFGNTMILAGAIVACTGLVLIGLYFVGREFRSLARRLEGGLPLPVPAAVPHEPAPAPLASARVPRPAPEPLKAVRPIFPRAQPTREDTLFMRDEPHDAEHGRDEFPDETALSDFERESHTAPQPWPDEQPAARVRHPVAPPEPPAPPAERPRRNIMFSSHRREPRATEETVRSTPPEDQEAARRPPAEDFQPRSEEPEAGSLFESAWPDRSRQDSSPRNGRGSAPPVTPRERFQPPRRADAESVSIVKSGVVDSMAYSLYSDGSIEAQMPEGMVRFASIEELRAHLDQR